MSRYVVTGISVLPHSDGTMTVRAEVTCDEQALARISANGRELQACIADLEEQTRELAAQQRKAVLDAAVVGRVLVEFDADKEPSNG